MLTWMGVGLTESNVFLKSVWKEYLAIKIQEKRIKINIDWYCCRVINWGAGCSNI
jgi:hypothetical protein